MSQSVFEGTMLCKYFAQGKCYKGATCKFAHGISALRAKPDLCKTKMCSDFKQYGACSRGKDCRFAHERNEIRRGQKKKVSQALETSYEAFTEDDLKKFPPPQARTISEASTTVTTPTSPSPHDALLDFEQHIAMEKEIQDVATAMIVTSTDSEARLDNQDFAYSDSEDNEEGEEKLDISVRNSFLHFEPISKAPILVRSRSSPALCGVLR